MRFFLLLLITISSQMVAQNRVSFFEEHIDFSIDSNYFYINGIYSFRNWSAGDVNQIIGFPFASQTDSIDLINVTDLNALQKVPFKTEKRAIFFNLQMLPNDTLDLNIQYRQKRATKNSYIITSTQSWGKPLHKAIYSFTAPAHLQIKTFSYPPDSMVIKGDEKVYYWKKLNFMPQKEFDVILNEE